MIKAYLEWIASQYEGEDIEVRYSVYEDETLLFNKFLMLDYEKPVVVGQVALLRLLRDLEEYKSKDIVVIVNDAAFYEIIKGTSTTKNKEVLNMSRKTKKELMRFQNVTFEDVSENHKELMKWNEMLQS